MTPRTVRLTGAAVFAVGVVVALALWSEEGPRTVAVPAAGAVSAGFVDAHPVFVTHDEDGTVAVLDAVSPHSSFPKVLAWCRSSGAFEDLWHGSVFDAEGGWLGGPAPTGMAGYDIVDRRGDLVWVGERRPAPPRPSDISSDHELDGPRCDARTALYGEEGNPGLDPAVLDDLVLHDVDGDAGDRFWFPTRSRILGEEPIAPARVAP